MKHPSEVRPHLRLVTVSAPAHHAWFSQADRDGIEHLRRHGHLLSDPSLTRWVIEQCAELIWESHRGTCSWAQLPITELWRRLANLHQFFPQARLVIAHYETLETFLPWLSAAGRLSRERCVSMLAELEQVSSPLLQRARAQLAARVWPACEVRRHE